MPDLIRLDKYISIAAGISRREAQALIKSGRVSEGGSILLRPENKINENAVILIDNRPVYYNKFSYIMMNKPAGVLSASRDPNRETVIDLVPPSLRRRGLFPAGRLDKDTTGLLIITDDGDFAHKLLAPKSGIPKYYLAALDKPASESTISAFREGVILADGVKCLPALLEILTPDGLSVRIKLREGKYHQIKRMLGSEGLGVLSLRREQIGALPLDPGLAEGECRAISTKELHLITKTHIQDDFME